MVFSSFFANAEPIGIDTYDQTHVQTLCQPSLSVGLAIAEMTLIHVIIRETNSPRPEKLVSIPTCNVT